MKYASIDIETTGLDKKRCQVLAIAAITEDTENPRPFHLLPKFRWLIKHETLYWEPVAKAMNEKLMNEFENPVVSKTFIANPKEVVQMLRMYLEATGFPVEKDRVKVLVAGKNFARFDEPFLNSLPGFTDLISIKSRLLDPAILYTDLLHDQEPPNLKECKRRAGIEDIEITHDPLYDAWDVIRVLRTKYGAYRRNSSS